jgi:hypothetical protein
MVGENRLVEIAPHNRLRVYTKHREYKYRDHSTTIVRARHVLEMCRCDGRNLVSACVITLIIIWAAIRLESRHQQCPIQYFLHTRELWWYYHHP